MAERKSSLYGSDRQLSVHGLVWRGAERSERCPEADLSVTGLFSARDGCTVFAYVSIPLSLSCELRE